MSALRVGLPLAIVIAGVLIGVIGGSSTAWEGAGLVISAGLSVALLNWFFRLGVRGDRDRAAEDRARSEFDRTGRWPDEPRS